MSFIILRRSDSEQRLLDAQVPREYRRRASVVTSTGPLAEDLPATPRHVPVTSRNPLEDCGL